MQIIGMLMISTHRLQDRQAAAREKSRNQGSLHFI